MELIKKVIKAKGFTLEQVASQMKNKNGGIGISQPSLSQMLNGNPSVSRVVEIAKIIGVSVSELIGEDGLYEIRSEEDARAYSALKAAEEQPVIETRRIKCPHCHKELVITVEEAPGTK